MALSTPSELWEGSNYSNNTTIATTSISPTANALLVVLIQAQDTASNNISNISDTFSGTGSWSNRVSNSWNFYSNSVKITAIFTAQAGSSPGSGTITATFTGDLARKHMAVYEITGFDTGTPTGYANYNNATGTSSLTVTLGGTPASDSLVIATIQSGAIPVESGTNVDITPGTGFTELAERWSGGIGGDLDTEYMYDKDSADSTADWTNLYSSTPTMYHLGAALEIAAASAGDLSVTISDTSAYQYTGVRVVS